MQQNDITLDEAIDFFVGAGANVYVLGFGEEEMEKDFIERSLGEEGLMKGDLDLTLLGDSDLDDTDEEIEKELDSILDGDDIDDEDPDEEDEGDEDDDDDDLDEDEYNEMFGDEDDDEEED
jgi:hypothetical protein